MASNVDEQEKDEEPSGTDTGKFRLGGDTRRVKLIKDISALTHIPKIEEIFLKTLEKVEEEYPDLVNEYLGLKNSLEKEFGEKVEGNGGKGKSYFFEVNRVEDPGKKGDTHWELGKFKLNVGGNIVNMIFSEFINRVDTFEIAPTRIQTDFVFSQPLNRLFQINFTKGSDSRVVGFVKIIEDDFVVTKTENMVKVNTRACRTVEKERLFKYMEDYSQISEGMYFTLRMLEAST